MALKVEVKKSNREQPLSEILKIMGKQPNKNFSWEVLLMSVVARLRGSQQATSERIDSKQAFKINADITEVNFRHPTIQAYAKAEDASLDGKQAMDEPASTIKCDKDAAILYLKKRVNLNVKHNLVILKSLWAIRDEKPYALIARMDFDNLDNVKDNEEFEDFISKSVDYLDFESIEKTSFKRYVARHPRLLVSLINTRIINFDHTSRDPNTESARILSDYANLAVSKKLPIDLLTPNQKNLQTMSVRNPQAYASAFIMGATVSQFGLETKEKDLLPLVRYFYMLTPAETLALLKPNDPSLVLDDGISYNTPTGATHDFGDDLRLRNDYQDSDKRYQLLLTPIKGIRTVDKNVGSVELGKFLRQEFHIFMGSKRHYVPVLDSDTLLQLNEQDYQQAPAIVKDFFLKRAHASSLKQVVDFNNLARVSVEKDMTLFSSQFNKNFKTKQEDSLSYDLAN